MRIRSGGKQRHYVAHALKCVGEGEAVEMSAQGDAAMNKLVTVAEMTKRLWAEAHPDTELLSTCDVARCATSGLAELTIALSIASVGL